MNIVDPKILKVWKDLLDEGKPLPKWFIATQIVGNVSDVSPSMCNEGVCIWFTGLSGSGKSTTTEVLADLLQEYGQRSTVLDGDIVRENLSRGLGFSKHDRDVNIRRIGFVASEIVHHGGLVICATVSPYKSTRNDVRNVIGHHHFIEVFVDTPLEVCEKRDSKGPYARARRGEIRGFTGIDDPYESPESPEIRLETISCSPEENARLIVRYLSKRHFISVPEDTSIR